MADFPWLRLRRLRRTETLREMFSETHLRPSDLVQPLFVLPGRGRRESEEGLPGIIRVTPDMALSEVDGLLRKGIRAVLLFGLPASKSPDGASACSPGNPLFEAASEIKRRFPEAAVLADICLCSHTESGHCGVVSGDEVANDPTLEILAKYSVAAAGAGCDAVAPSAMMDGMVRRIREALDEQGFQDTLIVSYSAKFASSLYGPFRAAARSAPLRGDRRGYQLPPGNAREALRELAADAEEGADVLMVKPALPYLDVLSAARRLTMLPLAAYCVSGEYAMIKSAAGRGWLEEEAAVMEVLTSIKRAGASLVVTYHAGEAAGWMGRAT
ncbi:porphobilinogen synthase [Candidatus Solincola tengchongensis]|uniref:porphobilinogen synthase n=1 Tax=Candidatus Solincola tengchongensis TaxID=2900693 RepID=UPI00257947BC|nr:porphobilinogen synthase [Candidatus Solincola tengchongensis]